MADFGGETRLTLSTGQTLKLRSMVKLDLTNIETSEGSNWNNERFRTVTPKGYGFEVDLEDSLTAAQWDAIHRDPSFNATFVEEHTGVTHMMTDCAVIGQPRVDRATGEVTGFGGHANVYTQTGA